LLTFETNILIGILNTLQQYFKISEYNENYRICALAWAKFARNIQFELSKPPEDRNHVGPFIRKNSEDLERLMETTPIFPKEIIKYLIQKLNKHEHSNIIRPPVLSGIYHSNHFRHQWYLKVPYNKDIEHTKAFEQSITINVEDTPQD
jgi:hypothetical protein